MPFITSDETFIEQIGHAVRTALQRHAVYTDLLFGDLVREVCDATERYQVSLTMPPIPGVR